MITSLLYYRHNHTQPCVAISKEYCYYQELTLVLKGEIHYAVNDVPYTLHAGDAIYIPDSHVRSRLESNNVDYVSFNFHATEKLFSSFYLKDCIEEVSRSLVRVFDCVFARTINLQDPRFISLLESLILQLRTEYSSNVENHVSKTVKQYVKTHLSEKITLEDLGQEVFLSPNYCERIFKQETGQSIVDYILDKRIEYAKNLLWDTSIKLTHVAQTVGYHDYGYFCRIFKKRTGYSPLQFRQQTQGKNV